MMSKLVLHGLLTLVFLLPNMVVSQSVFQEFHRPESSHPVYQGANWRSVSVPPGIRLQQEPLSSPSDQQLSPSGINASQIQSAQESGQQDLGASQQGSNFQVTQNPNDFIWQNETLPDWLEESGLQEYNPGQSTQQQLPQTQQGFPGQESQTPQPTPEQAKAAALTKMFGSSCDPVWCRPTLTGDWYGRRTKLAQSGITYRGRVTQFFFGVDGGVQEPVPAPFAAIGLEGGDTFEYTGNSQHDFLVDLEKFGGPQASKFVLTLENIWGNFGNVTFNTGSTTPSQFNALHPFDPAANGALRMTNFLYLQPVSERLILTAGKLRLTKVADNNTFAGGDGSDQFLNQAFVANPLFLDQLVISTFSMGAIMPRDWGSMTLSVIDPLERSTEFFNFGDLFADGMIALGQIRVNTNFFNKPGEHHIGGIYKNVDLPDLSFVPTPPTYPYPPAQPGVTTKDDTYTLYYGFDQFIGVYGKADKKGETPGWGLFGRVGLSDGGTGNPNANGWHVSTGIGGDSPFCSRRHTNDRFGIAYAFTATSDEWSPVAITAFGPRDSQVFESYYRYHVTPAISVTPDFQWIRGQLGGLTGGDDAFVYGMRMNIRL